MRFVRKKEWIFVKSVRAGPTTGWVECVASCDCGGLSNYRTRYMLYAIFSVISWPRFFIVWDARLGPNPPMYYDLNIYCTRLRNGKDDSID